MCDQKQLLNLINDHIRCEVLLFVYAVWFLIMLFALEPGFYEDGHFGIRIENVLITKDAKTANNFGGTKFYCFEHITVVCVGF